MKKISFTLIAALLMSILILCASAAESTNKFPAKDIQFGDDGSVYVLLENGNLVYGKGIDAEEVEVHYSNVKQNIREEKILFNDGRLLLTGKVADFFNANAREIVDGYFYDYLYIDNNNVLRGRQLGGTTEIKFMENVKKCIPSVKYGDPDRLMILTFDDTLYLINHKDPANITYEQIMTNVAKVIRGRYHSFILKQDGDILTFEENYNNLNNYTVNLDIVGYNLRSVDDIVIKERDSSTFRFWYVDKANTVYSVSKENKFVTTEVDTNVNKIYGIGDPDKTLYILKNNTLYKSAFGALEVAIEKLHDLIGNTIDFYMGMDGMVYGVYERDYTPYKYKKYDTDLTKVMYFGKHDGSQNDTDILFVNTFGQTFGAVMSGKGKVTISAKYPTSYTIKKTNVIINGKAIQLTSSIQVKNNRSMYPFRECLDNMGANVIWDPDARVAIGEYGRTIVKFPIGKNYYYINDVLYPMDIESYIDGGKTYIPIRYAAEALGFTVDWTAGIMSNTINIHR